MKKLLGWAALAIGVWWVINNPDKAAAIVHQAAHAITVILH